MLHNSFQQFEPFASNDEATETQGVQDSEIEENLNGYIGSVEDAMIISDAPNAKKESVLGIQWLYDHARKSMFLGPITLLWPLSIVGGHRVVAQRMLKCRCGCFHVVNNLEDAHEHVDAAISTTLKNNTPVYVSVSCNLPTIPHALFSLPSTPSSSANSSSTTINLDSVSCFWHLRLFRCRARVRHYKPFLNGVSLAGVVEVRFGEVQENANTLIIFVMGKCGVGKSSIVSSIKGERVVIVNAFQAS